MPSLQLAEDRPGNACGLRAPAQRPPRNSGWHPITGPGMLGSQRMSAKRKGLLGRLPGFRELIAIRNSVDQIEAGIAVQTALLQQQFVSWQLQSNPRYQDPKRLNRYEHQVYSQNG